MIKNLIVDLCMMQSITCVVDGDDYDDDDEDSGGDDDDDDDDGNRLGVVKLSQSFQISCKRLAWLDALKSTSIIQTSVDFMC